MEGFGAKVTILFYIATFMEVRAAAICTQFRVLDSYNLLFTSVIIGMPLIFSP